MTRVPRLLLQGPRVRGSGASGLFLGPAVVSNGSLSRKSKSHCHFFFDGSDEHVESSAKVKRSVGSAYYFIPAISCKMYWRRAAKKRIN